jgi:hypothetical protein
MTRSDADALRDALCERIRRLPDVEEGESAFGPGPGFWVGGKEVVHFDAPNLVDVRLTRAEIRASRAELRGDERVTLRASSSSDWLEARMTGPDDVAFVAGLVERAVAAHRPDGDGLPKPPPTGADLERRRRFH